MTQMSKKRSEERLKMYINTASDWEAAARLGIHRTTFRSWRRHRGLLCKRSPGGKHLSTVKEVARQDTYNRTSSDHAAAKVCGIPTRTFHSWRTSRKLPNKWIRLSDEERAAGYVRRARKKVCTVMFRVAKRAIEDGDTESLFAAPDILKDIIGFVCPKVQDLYNPGLHRKRRR